MECRCSIEYAWLNILINVIDNIKHKRKRYTTKKINTKVARNGLMWRSVSQYRQNSIPARDKRRFRVVETGQHNLPVAPNQAVVGEHSVTRKFNLSLASWQSICHRDFRPVHREPRHASFDGAKATDLLHCLFSISVFFAWRFPLHDEKNCNVRYHTNQL